MTNSAFRKAGAVPTRQACTIGGAGFGLLSLAGFAVGALAIGGSAIGLVAFGGIAVGWTLASGGIAMAHQYAAAGVAVAPHANDAAAHAYLRLFRWFDIRQSSHRNVAVVVLWLPVILLGMLWPVLHRRLRSSVDRLD